MKMKHGTREIAESFAGWVEMSVVVNFRADDRLSVPKFSLLTGLLRGCMHAAYPSAAKTGTT